MVQKFKTLYEKIMLREIRKNINNPDYPFDELDLWVYTCGGILALIILIIALWNA